VTVTSCINTKYGDVAIEMILSRPVTAFIGHSEAC